MWSRQHCETGIDSSGHLLHVTREGGGERERGRGEGERERGRERERVKMDCYDPFLLVYDRLGRLKCLSGALSSRLGPPAASDPPRVCRGFYRQPHSLCSCIAVSDASWVLGVGLSFFDRDFDEGTGSLENLGFESTEPNIDLTSRMLRLPLDLASNCLSSSFDVALAIPIVSVINCTHLNDESSIFLLAVAIL